MVVFSVTLSLCDLVMYCCRNLRQMRLAVYCGIYSSTHHLMQPKWPRFQSVVISSSFHSERLFVFTCCVELICFVVFVLSTVWCENVDMYLKTEENGFMHQTEQNKVKKWLNGIVLYSKPISKLWSVACHIGSHGTWHRWTCPAINLARQTGTRFTHSGEMEECNLSVLVFLTRKLLADVLI